MYRRAPDGGGGTATLRSQCHPQWPTSPHRLRDREVDECGLRLDLGWVVRVGQLGVQEQAEVLVVLHLGGRSTEWLGWLQDEVAVHVDGYFTPGCQRRKNWALLKR